MADARDNSTADLSPFPTITFGDVETYVQKQSGCVSTTKAYKFFAEPGYLHDIKVIYGTGLATVIGKCFRSMKKNEPPHKVEANIKDSKDISGKCSCVAGAGGFCNHVIGILFYMAHCKQMGLKSLPDDLTCTSMQQRWNMPRGRKIEQKEVQDVLVKKPQAGADYTKYVKSTLYSPEKKYELLSQSHFEGLHPKPLMATIVPKQDNLQNIPFVATKFGNALKGSVISYQQRVSNEYIINDYTCPGFPDLPLIEAEDMIKNNYSGCLDEKKAASLDSLAMPRDVSIDIEKRTVTQSSNNLWHLLRNKRITASKFGLVAKRISSFENLVTQLNPSRHVVTADMRRGIELEGRAAEVYAKTCKNNNVNLYPSGLIINPKCPWLGCSPDRKVYDMELANQGQYPYGLLEVKVVKAGVADFKQVRYLTTEPGTNDFKLKENHEYYYQVQCQLGLTGLSWCDFFSYISDTQFVCIRIPFDGDFFQSSKDKVDSFFFNYFPS